MGSVQYYSGNHLNEKYCYDSNGKKWSIVSDSSIKNEYGEPQESYGCELVTPILETVQDYENLVKVVENLKNNGGLVSEYCGLHVHADSDKLDYKGLIKCIQHMYTRQDLLFRFCKVYSDRIYEWCQPINETLARACKKTHNSNELKNLWYKVYGGSEHAHYSLSRYHNLNLHSYFEGKGVEFRLFNSTLDSEKVMVIIDLIKGFVMDSINSQDMSQYLHTDRTVYSNPDRMYTLLSTYSDRMQLNHNTKKFLLSENL